MRSDFRPDPGEVVGEKISPSAVGMLRLLLELIPLANGKSLGARGSHLDI